MSLSGLSSNTYRLPTEGENVKRVRVRSRRIHRTDAKNGMDRRSRPAGPLLRRVCGNAPGTWGRSRATFDGNDVVPSGSRSSRTTVFRCGQTADGSDRIRSHLCATVIGDSHIARSDRTLLSLGSARLPTTDERISETPKTDRYENSRPVHVRRPWARSTRKPNRI